MITYNGLDLFGSGPSTLDPGPLDSRIAPSDVPDAAGASIVLQGVGPRTITQHGTLVADNASALQVLVDAIEAQVGSGGATLTDNLGKDWPGCVMQRFDPGVVDRLGPRFAVDYTITYLQATA